MNLYEGAVKKPIMTSLCFLAVVIFGLFSLSKYRYKLDNGDDCLSGSQCVGY